MTLTGRIENRRITSKFRKYITKFYDANVQHLFEEKKLLSEILIYNYKPNN
jgi:hypothetical protein